MRAVVTGAAGFVGTHLVAALRERGWDVVGTDRRPGADHRADLVDADLDPLVGGADVVLHLAGRASARASWREDFDGYLHDNVRATQRLLHACHAARVGRVVLASSSSVYGGAAPLPTPEDAPTAPVSPYGATKVMAEGLAAAYGAQGLDVVVLRYFTVYGPGQRPDMLLARAIDAALHGDELLVFGDGRQTRDFTFVGDAVEATIAAGTRGPAGRTYNVGGGAPVAVRDVLGRVAALCGGTLTTAGAAAHAADVRDTAADVSRARGALGFVARTTLDDGLAAQVAARRAALAAPSADRR
ncbi:NAD-dependent epimerase/dehydratase family protein [Patulibacter minatonensis]|uniref:NAD-dependent epimerase/dehydratase family protein n=1 Tax=Patulibacter minatonensis TaxID=298163 RepID=UPI00047A8D61|nr:NAD-dependent epimerase/dehydratase family protein [Patulibacter minatonensis]